MGRVEGRGAGAPVVGVLRVGVLKGDALTLDITF